MFYKDATLDDWVAFNTGMPAVDVRELEIYKGTDYSNRRLKAATYGRGLWSSDLIEMGVINPANFEALPTSVSAIDLTWTKNASNDNVMLAFNTTNTFGTPANSSTYAAGASISGGGTVLYNGGNISFTHNSLSTNTTYYYKAWSVNASNQYSLGTSVNASTFCTLIGAFPWTTNFENGGSIPSCWVQSYQTGSHGWAFQNGGMTGGSHPAAAHSGSYNACLYVGDYSHPVTRLISPPMDLSGLAYPVLRFWHTQEYWAPDQDELRIYYRTSPSGGWTLLASYTSSIVDWTQESILLPNPSTTYYLAFEGRANYAYGVCVDDIVVNESQVTWNGTGDWSNAANWTPPFIPAEFDNIVINSGTCSLNSSITCKSLTVQPGAFINVNPSVVITITGTTP